MLKPWLSDRLNRDLADSIVQIAAAVTIQSHARRKLAIKEAQTRRDSGDYAFHQGDGWTGCSLLDDTFSLHRTYPTGLCKCPCVLSSVAGQSRTHISSLCDNVIGTPPSLSAFAPGQHQTQNLDIPPPLSWFECIPCSAPHVVYWSQANDFVRVCPKSQCR